MRSVVLSGPSGAGKSSVGARLASLLGLPFVDTDAALEQRCGETVAELWRRRGERGFREEEARLARELVLDGAARVIAFGGGTVTDREVRHLALERAFVVTLTASPTALASRLGDGHGRPLLTGGGVEARLRVLLVERAELYAESHLTVATDLHSVEELAEAVARAATRRSVVVPLGTRSYRVDLTRGSPSSLTATLESMAPSSVVVVTDATVHHARGAWWTEAAGSLAVPVREVVLSPGEPAKTLASVQAIWEAAVDARADRRAVVVGFGGGVVGDLAGFAAATLLRGVRVVQVPTTLLAMVDASVGGKTGFDLPQGKNLIGAFHQPSAVVADLAQLATLPLRDLRAGLAEVVKVALVCDEPLWDELERSAERLAEGDLDALEPIVHGAVLAKVRIVRDDERESGRRVLLNVGHTVGHALEAARGYARYRHGEAVALGLVAETAAAEALGLAEAGLSARVRALLVRLGLPVTMPEGELEAAWGHVSQDKKRSEGSLDLPVARSVGVARPERVSPRDLARALGVTSHG